MGYFIIAIDFCSVRSRSRDHFLFRYTAIYQHHIVCAFNIYCLVNGHDVAATSKQRYYKVVCLMEMVGCVL